MKDIVEEINAPCHKQSANDSDERGTGQADHIAACSNSHKPGQNSIAYKRERRFPEQNPGKGQSGKSAGCCGHIGRAENARYGSGIIRSFSTQLRAGIESEPSEPENEYS